MARVAERLTILNEAGTGYLERLNYINQIVTHPKLRPAFFIDKNLEKTVKEMTRKFPEFPPDIDRLAGSDLVLAKARECFDKLEAAFQLFMDIAEWKDEVMKVLNEAATAIPSLKYDDNPFTVSAYLDLVALLGQVITTMSELPERRALVVVYARAYYNMKAQQEPNFGRIAHFVHDYDKPMRRLPEELRNASPRVGQALCSFAMDWIKSRDVAVLRKEGSLSLSTNPAQMSLPSQEPFMYLLGSSAKLFNWVTYGFLLCPDELALSEALPMLKIALSTAYVAPLSREMSYYVHDEYDEAFDKHKNKTFKAQLKKEKNFIKDVQTAAVNTRHRDRRVYIRQELANLYGLLRDQPGVVAPKIQLILSALSVAREELFWYFRHLDTPPPKSAGVKQTREPDTRIPELIYHIDALVQFVKTHASLVRQYYVQYLNTSDYQRASELATELQNKVPSCAAPIRAILEACKSAREGSDLRALRLNWLRAEVAISSANVPLPPLNTALKKFALVARHSRYVDQLDELLAEAASMRHLWYWRESFIQAFDKCLETASLQPQYAMAFIRVLAQCPDNAGTYTPEERDLIGPECVNLAKSCLDKLAHRVATLVSEIAKNYVSFESQLHVEHAAYPWLVRMKDFKPDKNVPAPVPPGSESEFKQRANFDNLRVMENALHQMLTAVNESVSVHVFDHLLTPREFVRDALAGCLKDFMQKIPLSGASPEQGMTEPEIQRPSVVERYLHVYCSYLKSLENYLDLPVSDIIREVWIGNIYHKSLSGQLLDWTTEGALDVSGMVKPFCGWYAEFVARRVVSTKEREVFFSPNRRGFYSKTGMAFKAEKFAEITELRALCNLIGPYGVKLLDRELLRQVQAAVAALKENISNNRAALDELGKNFLKEQVFTDALKKLKVPDVEAFVGRLLQIGNALSFRALLHEALRLTTEEKIPYIFSAVNAAFNQYPRNTFSSTDCLAVDCLAKELGIEVTSADHALKAYMQRGMGGGDAAVWNLLPTLCACSMLVSRHWAETEFRPNTEVLAGNLNTLPLAIAELITATRSVATSTNPDPREITVALMSFVEISATLILRQLRVGKQSSSSPKNISSLVVFIDKFVEATPFVSRDMVEALLPYSLVRTMYRELYDTKGPAGSVEQDQ